MWRSSTRRSCTSAGSSGCSSASATGGRSRCSSGSRSTRGSTRCAVTGRRRRASCPRRCAWCSRPTSIPPISTSLRSVVSGTAPLDPADADAFAAKYGVPVLVSYAATEFGGGVAGWNLADHRAFWAAKRGSVGRAHAGCELRVVEPETGEPLGPGRRGPARGEGRPARRRRLGAHHRPGPHRRRRVRLDPRPRRPGDHPRRLQGAARGRARRARAPPRRARRSRGESARRAARRGARRGRRAARRGRRHGQAATTSSTHAAGAARPLRAPDRDPRRRRTAAHRLGQGRPRRRRRPVRRRRLARPDRWTCATPTTTRPSARRSARGSTTRCPRTARRPRPATGPRAAPTTPVAAAAARRRVRGPRLAGGVRRPGPADHRSSSSTSRSTRARTRRTSASTSSARMHAGPTLIAEGTDEQRRVPPPAHPPGRERVVSGVLGAGGRARTSRRCARGRCGSATSTS